LEHSAVITILTLISNMTFFSVGCGVAPSHHGHEALLAPFAPEISFTDLGSADSTVFEVRSISLRTDMILPWSPFFMNRFRSGLLNAHSIVLFIMITFVAFTAGEISSINSSR
jgi:hypothetical protein